MFRHLPTGVVLFLLVAPNGADAQIKWDIAGIAGLFAGHSPDPEAQHYQQDWFQTGLGGVVIGRHFTSNLKVELEATRTGEGTQYVQRLVSIPGVSYPYPLSAEAQTTVTSVGTTLAWQFFENQWIHPFVHAGVAADIERRVVDTWPQQHYSGDPRQGGVLISIAEQIVAGPDTTTTVRAVLGGGVKMYVSPRLFVRSDGRAALGQRRQHVSFRVGFGADF